MSQEKSLERERAEDVLTLVDIPDLCISNMMDVALERQAELVGKQGGLISKLVGEVAQLGVRVVHLESQVEAYQERERLLVRELTASFEVEGELRAALKSGVRAFEPKEAGPED